MARTRLYKWQITIKDPPDKTHTMRDIRRGYHKMRTSGMTVADARYVVVNLLICGGLVKIKGERIQ
jgi:hypothetical protein